MESKNRGIQTQQPSAPFLQSTDFIPLTDFVGAELGRSHVIPFQGYNQHLHPLQHSTPHPVPHLHPHPPPFASPQSYEIQEAIEREIEKSKIREQMIIDEIVTRRMIESEVRRELMQQKALALRQGINGFSFGLPPAMGLDLPERPPAILSVAEGRLLDQRNMLSHFERERLNSSWESGRCDTLPFQRGTTNPRVSEFKFVSEGGKEKEKIILLPKPDEVSGSKRKAEMPLPAADASENLSKDILRKRAKEEWSCALCQVSATSERGLNDHLEGKKHKAKESKLKAKAAKKHLGKSIKVEGSVSHGKEDRPKPTPEPLPSQMVGEPNSKMNDQGLLQKSPNENHLRVVQTMPTSGDPKKENFKFWCEICQVGAHSMKVMDAHKTGRKHLFRIRKNYQNTGDDTSDQNETIMNHQGVSEDNKNIAPDKVGKASGESKPADHVATDAVKTSIDHEAKAQNETKEGKDCVADDGASTNPDAFNDELSGS